MSLELDIQKSVIILTEIGSSQYHWMLIIELVIKSELDPLECDTDVLPPLEHIDSLRDISSDIISVHNFADFTLNFFFGLFALICLLTILLILHLFEHILIHTRDKQRFEILTVLSLRMIFGAIVGSHFLFWTVN